MVHGRTRAPAVHAYVEREATRR